MLFVTDEQFEGIAILCNQIPCGVIRRHGQREDAFLATIVHANLCLEGIG